MASSGHAPAPPVGFIGLGNMGEGMAHNLAIKGFCPVVHDRRSEPVDRLVAEGALAARTCADVGARCTIACVAVFDEAQVDQTVFGAGDDAGLLAGMSAGGTIVLHPTVPPATVLRVADASAQRGVAVVDAPMTGGSFVAARDGTLTFMVGGDDAIVARVRPVLAAMATTIFHVGGPGAGAAAKIINNCLSISHSLMVREALRLARSVGVSERAILEIVNAGETARCWQTLNWERIKTLEHTHTDGVAGVVAMATKDLTLALRMAHDQSVDTPSLAALVERGLPDIARSGLTDNGFASDA